MNRTISTETIKKVGETVKLNGWVHVRRNMGKIAFLDLRDRWGITQVVCVPDELDKESLEILNEIRPEFVLEIEGLVQERGEKQINKDMVTGTVEILAKKINILSKSETPPFEIDNEDRQAGEELRLKYRYLDLRHDRMKNNMQMRSKMIHFLRNYLNDKDFIEIQTPILSKSTPEGARDYLVPSRKFPGKFFALPQAPQQYKQMLMVAGMEKYFQIAPCFRDEDARADRSPGEFYQLDLEMSFVEQEDVFRVVEQLIVNVFKEFSSKKLMHESFPRISYEESMLKYGSDKPDLRNPLVISDLTEIFSREDVTFEIFKKLVKSGSKVRCIVTKNTKDKPRSFFDNIDKWAKEQGASGLAYFTIEKDDNVTAKGPVGKFFSEESLKEIMKITGADIGDSVFFACGKINEVEKITALARDRIARDLDLIDENIFAFCWIVDYPMFEKNEITNKIEFSHNPFSMPQGDIKDIDFDNPLKIKAYQYDIVCNGIELSSGAIRNHVPELMYKLFSIAGYQKKHVDEKFSGMINALSYGAPPHGGIAPGIDRIVMLLANEKNIREVTMFPMNQNAQDLMMNAPSDVSENQLKELGLAIKLKK